MNLPNLEHKDSLAIDFVKSVAIFATIAAHTNGTEATGPFTEAVSVFWGLVGSIGIGSFWIVGGSLYNRTAGDSGTFWRKRAVSLILPWIFCAVLTWSYRRIRGYGNGVFDLLLWTVGYSSVYYFAFMNLLMLAFFKLLHNRTWALWSCVAVTGACAIAASRGIVNPVDTLIGSQYLNPMNWAGYFALGILLRRKGLRIGKGLMAAAALVFAVISVIAFRMKLSGFFHVVCVIFAVSGFLVLFWLGRKLAATAAAKAFRWIGRTTYCIYLLHLPIVQGLLRQIPDSPTKLVLAPVIGMVTMLVLVTAGSWISRKLPFGDKLRMLVGLRP